MINSFLPNEGGGGLAGPTAHPKDCGRAHAAEGALQMQERGRWEMGCITGNQEEAAFTARQAGGDGQWRDEWPSWTGQLPPQHPGSILVKTEEAS